MLCLCPCTLALHFATSLLLLATLALPTLPPKLPGPLQRHLAAVHLCDTGEGGRPCHTCTQMDAELPLLRTSWSIMAVVTSSKLTVARTNSGGR